MRRQHVYWSVSILLCVVLLDAVALAEATTRAAATCGSVPPSASDPAHHVMARDRNSVDSALPSHAAPSSSPSYEQTDALKKKTHVNDHTNSDENKNKNDDDDEDDDDDQFTPTWLLDGDVVYAETRSRHPEALPPPPPPSIRVGRANGNGAHNGGADGYDEDDDAEDGDGVLRVLVKRGHRRHASADIGEVSVHKSGATPTLEELTLLVMVETTSGEHGDVTERVQTRVGAHIGNVPSMDDHVASKIAVALAVSILIFTMFVIVIT